MECVHDASVAPTANSTIQKRYLDQTVGTTCQIIKRKTTIQIYTSRGETYGISCLLSGK